MHFVLPDQEFRSVLSLLMEVTGNRTRLGTITAKAVGPGVKADRRPSVCSNKSAAAYFSLFVFNSLLMAPPVTQRYGDSCPISGWQ